MATAQEQAATEEGTGEVITILTVKGNRYRGHYVGRTDDNLFIIKAIGADGKYLTNAEGKVIKYKGTPVEEEDSVAEDEGTAGEVQGTGEESQVPTPRKSNGSKPAAANTKKAAVKKSVQSEAIPAKQGPAPKAAAKPEKAEEKDTEPEAEPMEMPTSAERDESPHTALVTPQTIISTLSAVDTAVDTLTLQVQSMRNPDLLNAEVTARKMGRAAWRVLCACRAELVRRTAIWARQQKPKQKVNDAIERAANELGISSRLLRADAQVWNTFFATKDTAGNDREDSWLERAKFAAEQLDDKEFLTQAMRFNGKDGDGNEVDPLEALELLVDLHEAAKAEGRDFSTTDARKAIAQLMQDRGMGKNATGSEEPGQAPEDDEQGRPKGIAPLYNGAAIPMDVMQYMAAVRKAAFLAGKHQEKFFVYRVKESNTMIVDNAVQDKKTHTALCTVSADGIVS